MDRTFAFFDQPGLLRHPPNQSNHTSSSTLLPHAGLIQSQHASNPPSSQHPNPMPLSNTNPNISSQPAHTPQSSLPQSSAHQANQSLHLHPMDSHDPHNPANTHPSHRQSQYPMHHLHSQSAHTHPSAHNPHHSPVSASGALPQSQSLQTHSHHHPHHHPSQPHQQLAALHMPHAASHINSLNLSASSAPSYSASTLAQNNAHFAHTVASRDTGSHPNAFPMHSQHPHVSQQLQSNSFANVPPEQGVQGVQGVQSINMQPLLPSQQQPQSFNSLAHIPGTMLQPGVVDDPNHQSHHHYPSQQPGDALTAAASYSWDTAAANQQNMTNHAQQSLVPIPLVSDTRASPVNNAQTTSANYPNQAAGQSFGQVLGTNMGVLGSSLGMGGLANGNALAPNVANVQPALAPATDLSTRNAYPIADAANRSSKVIKKGRVVQQRKQSATRITRGIQGPNATLNVNVANIGNMTGRAPITSPVSTATLPNIPTPPPQGGQSTSPGIGSARALQRNIKAGKVKGRARVGPSGAHVSGVVGTTSTTLVAGRDGPGNSVVGPVVNRVTATAAAVAANAFGEVKHVGGAGIGAGIGAVGVGGVTTSGATVGWSGSNAAGANVPVSGSIAKKSSGKRSRRKGDANSTPVPVHLRNPKKGRARVFRECKVCREENHIRRSDCSNCKAPLPAGKRRRDGNPSYDTKRRAAVTSPAASAAAIRTKAEPK